MSKFGLILDSEALQFPDEATNVNLRQTMEASTRDVRGLKIWYSLIFHLWETRAYFRPTPTRNLGVKMCWISKSAQRPHTKKHIRDWLLGWA